MTQPFIEVADLECRYGGRVVLTGVTFSVRPSELLFVIGGSGTGKSTLLRAMIGLLEPAKGEIRFKGLPLLGPGGRDWGRCALTYGVLFQNGALWSAMTVGENVALPLEEHARVTPDEIKRLVRLKLDLVGLEFVEDMEPSELSGGMRKRAALARALALDPPVLFLDEPSSGLDPQSTRQLNKLLLGLRETLGTTMIVISHHIESILEVADRVILLDPETKGVAAEGDPRKLARESPDPRVRAFFGEVLA